MEIDSSVSAVSLQSLDDDDFRNLLNKAVKPQYGSLKRRKKKSKKTSLYGGRRLSDAGENASLSVEADNILEQFRREAELNQRNADIETEQQRTVTAFIEGTTATSLTLELLGKYSVKETLNHHQPPKRNKCGINGNYNNNGNNVAQFSSTSFEKCRTDAEGNHAHIAANDEIADVKNGNCDNAVEITGGPQTTNKPANAYISFENKNFISQNGFVDESRIAYIDEDEQPDDLCSVPATYFGKNQEERMNGNHFKNAYTQGNLLQEIRALNDTEDDDLIEGGQLEGVEGREIGTMAEAATAVMDDNNRIQKATSKASSNAGERGQHDDNPFHYSSGQLRLHGNRVGTYEMQKSRSFAMANYEEEGPDVSLIPANPSSSLLSRNLLPAQFDSRENYVQGFLDPTEDTRLNPQQVSPDSEMANQKNPPDKCAIAKRRKENKKAKEAKNSYVVEPKDGYMGNLSPEEILKRIEGDSKRKTKGNHKSGANVSKDQSCGLSNAPKNNSGRKKSDKKDRSEKVTRRGGNTDLCEVASLSTKMETLNIEKEKAAVAETTAEMLEQPPLYRAVINTPEAELPTATPTGEVNTQWGSSVATKSGSEKVIPADEGLDDEEQYMSADEGAASNVSDDYHTDEQSGASGSRDFISDGANYRADDEEVIPLPVTSEEAEFIPVTARSKKRGGGTAVAQQNSTMGNDWKNVYINSLADRGNRPIVRRSDVDRPRRGSMQLPLGTFGSRGNQPAKRANTSPSPADIKGFQRYPANMRRTALLSDYIDDVSILKGQGNRASGRTFASGSSSYGGVGGCSQPQLQPKLATSMESKKTKYGAPSSLQTSRTASPSRRSSQPPIGKYFTAAGSQRPSDLTIYPTGSQGSFAKACLSPSHKTEIKDRSLPFGTPILESNLSGMERKGFEKQITIGVSGADDGKFGGLESSSSSVPATITINAPGIRSWADIAKKRPPGEINEARSQASTRDISPELRSFTKEDRSFSAASSLSGNSGAVKKEYSEQKQAMHVEAVSNDPTVKGSRMETSSVFENEPKKAVDAKTFVQPPGGVVLNLEGGRRIVLPGGDAAFTGSTVVSSRQRSELQFMRMMWKEFSEGSPAPIPYKELIKRRTDGKAQKEARKKNLK